MPVLAVCDGCHAEYDLKDEYAGKKVKCKDCGSVIVVPMVSTATAWQPPNDGGGGPFDHDRFLINQKKVSISERYYVFDAHQNPILFVERPAHFWRSLGAVMAGLLVAAIGVTVSAIPAVALDDPQTRWIGGAAFLIGFSFTLVATVALIIRLTPKRHISIYVDDSKNHLLVEILQDQKVNFIRATYTVRAPDEGTLGQFRKNYFYNFFRKRWDAFRPDGTPLVVAREDSLILSLLRRFLGPMLGLLRTNFVFYRPNTEIVIGEFNRKATLFDRYVLDMSTDRAHELDRRMAVALGILLDTGERR
ncbi:hypothetical protein V5E97_22340 [Singulisphaera sp. Ch08]|uniref:DUF3137 domain-containing protein n=1 Tax=Singulisphaera sp. Ch08 TaxID=3120278 RepID=A0AAU7C7U8_9BACT